MEALGINDYDFIYYELSDKQDFLEEINGITNFLSNDFVMYLKKNYPQFFSENMKIKFINWGHMELVYVLDVNGKSYTLLLNQPKLEFGKVKEEFDNLTRLSKGNEDVVKPILYYNNKEREIYMTPYYKQARCISYLDDKLGIYIPEPKYHFSTFDDEVKDVIEEVITAKIISLYNRNINVGLDEFSVSSGDFILLKHFDDYINNPSKLFDEMKVIAARKLINLTIDDYIDLIYERLSSFDASNIDKGIDLGISKVKK